MRRISARNLQTTTAKTINPLRNLIERTISYCFTCCCCWWPIKFARVSEGMVGSAATEAHQIFHTQLFFFFILLLSHNATTCSTSPFGGDCRRPPTIPSARSGYLLASIHLCVIGIVFCFGLVGWLGWFRFGVLLHVRSFVYPLSWSLPAAPA